MLHSLSNCYMSLLPYQLCIYRTGRIAEMLEIRPFVMVDTNISQQCDLY